jgi:serine/threonine protein kinase
MHRDLKLANILIDNNNTLKLADFGLSVQLQSNDEIRTSKCGNFRTLAPEVLLNASYDIKADCWALGVVL